MSAATWLTVAIVGFSLSGIALVTAVLMFIKMKIPSVIGDLSGRTVAREVRAIKNENAQSAKKSDRFVQVNPDGRKPAKKAPGKDFDIMETQTTETLSETRQTDILSGVIVTEHLSETRQTDILSQNTAGIGLTERMSTENNTEKLKETEVLSETEALSEAAVLNETTMLNGTTVLSDTEEMGEVQKAVPVAFRTVRSEIVLHTDEIV